MPRAFVIAALSAIAFACSTIVAQEPATEPTPMVDPLRSVREEQRDAWANLAEQCHASEKPVDQLRAAWALFHQFDTDYFTLLEGDGRPVLDKYDRQIKLWSKAVEDQANDHGLARLAVTEFNALLDDVAANRLQAARPEGLPGDAPQVQAWNAKFERFQIARIKALQERGKQLVVLYRAGDIDALRPCVALLERQIAERVLLEHDEMVAPAEQAEDVNAKRRAALLTKHQEEWKRLRKFLHDTTSKEALIDLGEQVCDLHLLTLDLLTARRAAKKADDERVSELAKKVFAAYQSLQREAAKQHLDGRVNVEQLARVHDLRMYTTLWNDAALPPADAIADLIEVAQTWAKLHELLTKDDAESTDAQIARAKKLETEIAQKEPQGTMEPEKEAVE
jgi:hypothetical protein